jgi:hypothetical protein
MNETFWSKCVMLLQRDDVKSEIKQLFSPVVDDLLVQIYPYIYLSLIFVIVSFLLHLGIFILLWRNNYFLRKD